MPDRFVPDFTWELCGYCDPIQSTSIQNTLIIQRIVMITHPFPNLSMCGLTDNHSQNDGQERCGGVHDRMSDEDDVYDENHEMYGAPKWKKLKQETKQKNNKEKCNRMNRSSSEPSYQNKLIDLLR
eukprot:949853_1